jgi:uncharacterized metal-binding protein YceD (DUF177 family)
MNNEALPYSHMTDLSRLPVGETEFSLTPNEDERARMAQWLSVDGLMPLEAKVRVIRQSEHYYTYEASLVADVVQSCVVTLEPVPSHIERQFRRLFEVVSGMRQRPAGRTVHIAIGEEDEPELLDNPVVDLAAPVLEELSLAIEPYPRVPGAIFHQPPEQEPRTSPFEVLKVLKTRR